MKPLRLFLYFVVGLMLSMAAGFSFAANIQIGTYYQYGNQITRKVTTVADQTKLTRQVLNVAMEDSRTVGITTQFAYGMESGLVQGRILDTIKADSGVFTTMAETTAANGLKAGLKGGLGAIAASLLADYLTTKGLQWMDQAKCEVTAGCTTSGWNKTTTSTATSMLPDSYGSRCKARLHSNWDPYISGIDISVSSVVTVDDGVQVVLQCVAHTIAPYAGTRYDNDYYNIPQATSPCPAGYTLNYGTYACDPSSAPTFSTPSQSEINAAVDDATISNIKPMINAIAQDGTTVSIPDATPTSTSGDPVTGTPKGSSSTTKNPDGSTVTENKNTTPTYTPQGDGTTGGPIKVVTNNTTNTTTNTCTASGSCSTTNTTTTNSGGGSGSGSTDSTEQQTDCDKYPDSLGCAGFGTPDDTYIPTSTNSNALSWTSLSMPATCPSDIALSWQGHPFSFSFKYFCQFAQYIKALVLASALISAYFICFGARKETT